MSKFHHSWAAVEALFNDPVFCSWNYRNCILTAARLADPPIAPGTIKRLENEVKRAQSRYKAQQKRKRVVQPLLF